MQHVFSVHKALRVFLCFIFVVNLMAIAPTAYAAETRGTILVAFGTTVDRAKIALDAIEKAYTQENTPILWAYTSDIIRKKLEKNGDIVFSVHAALNKAAELGWREVRVQSLHVGVAEEFQHLNRMLARYITLYPDKFDSVVLGHPLLESQQDMEEVMASVLAELPKERKPNEAVVLMGHGNDRGPGDIMLYALGKAFQEKDPLVFVAAVEGSSTFDKVLVALKKNNVQRVWLQPFMIVAGDHAINDMAGSEEDSWAEQIKAAGMEVYPILHGLGEQKGVHAVFLRHTQESSDDMVTHRKMD